MGFLPIYSSTTYIKYAPSMYLSVDHRKTHESKTQRAPEENVAGRGIASLLIARILRSLKPTGNRHQPVLSSTCCIRCTVLVRCWSSRDDTQFWVIAPIGMWGATCASEKRCASGVCG